MPWYSLYSFKYSSIFNNMDAEDKKELEKRW